MFLFYYIQQCAGEKVILKLGIQVIKRPHRKKYGILSLVSQWLWDKDEIISHFNFEFHYEVFRVRFYSLPFKLSVFKL